MKNTVVIALVLVFGACGESMMQQQAADLQFEVLRTASPLTGEVPSELRYQLLPKVMGEANWNKKAKVYPNSWQVVDDQFASLAITRIVADPRQPQHYYFCTGEGWYNSDAARGAGIWKSVDAGESWTRLTSTTGSDFFYCQDLAIHPQTSDLYVATRAGGLLRSQDGGQTWNKVLGDEDGTFSNSAADIEIAANGSLFVSFGVQNTGGIFRSASGDSASWSKIMNGFPTSPYRRIVLATAPSDSSVIYAIPEGTNRLIAGVFRSADAGDNWSEVSLPGGDHQLAKIQAWYDLIIKVDPNDANTVVAGGLNIWRSRDGGQNWQQLTEGDRRKHSSIQYVHVDQHEVVFQNSDTVYFANDGGIYRCDAFAADTPVLYAINDNYNVTQFYTVEINPFEGEQMVMGGTQDNGSSRSLNSGVSDFAQVSWADGGFSLTDNEDPSYWYTTTQYRRIIRTHGDDIDSLTNPNLTDLNTIWVNPLVFDENDAQILYQASNRGVWRLKWARTASPSQWEKCTRNYGSVSALASATDVPHLLMMGRSGTATPYRIENAHITDENYTPKVMDLDGELPSGAYLNCIYIDPADANHVILVYSNYDIESVYESKDALTANPHWVSVEGNLPNVPIRWATLHPENKSVCYLATEMGMYYTDQLNDSNTVWQKSNGGLPNLRMDMIIHRAEDGVFAIGSHGRGIFTGVQEEGSYDLQWKERGPRNVGGRTRTLLLDPNVPGKAWAGSVSGGLWVVQNIDSTNVYYEEESSLNAGIYPNPVVNKLHIQFEPENAAHRSITVYNRIGQKVYHQADAAISSDISTTAWARGIYFVELIAGDSKLVEKVLKQ